MKILVTGGAGFIGSHVAAAFQQAGHEVHVVDDLSSGRAEHVPRGVSLHVLDIRSPEIERLWGEHRFEVLCHHAAQMDVRRSVADPLFDADVNVLGTLRLLEAGRRNGLRKVIFASTGGAIYGEPVYAPQDEEHPVQPVSPYGVSKLAAEKYLHYYYVQYGIPYVALRYANVYGPRQNPHGEAGVVAIFTERMLLRQQPLIYGDGLQTRDFVYVGDVVRANLLALACPEPEVFNVGTGRETDVLTLFRLIRQAVGADVPELHGPPRSGEQRRSVLDFAKIHRRLGWEPQVSLEEGIQRTVAYFRQALCGPHSA
ncbi:MAG: GDP-mannose 4,6-dehydratase [Bacteroidota bacterium]|nr:GDP-mannose 4,6-dehydratase [Bacteroidota bacterium]MDW8138362.1 GDP-mannose 4,6-dehydratase [Bacteroidota bacterium]